MRQCLDLLDHCLARYQPIAKQWDESKNWELLSPMRITECDERFHFICKFREAADRTIIRFEQESHAPAGRPTECSDSESQILTTMSVYLRQFIEPPPLPGHAPAAGPARFAPGMSGRDLLGIIFRVCRELRVSDIQMRAARPVYIHTNKGMEKLEFLGILSRRQHGRDPQGTHRQPRKRQPRLRPGPIARPARR